MPTSWYLVAAPNYAVLINPVFVQPIENNIISSVLATVPIPLSGADAARLSLDDKLNTNPTLNQGIEEIFTQLSLLTPNPPQCETLYDKAHFINRFQHNLSTTIDHLGAPPKTPYNEISNQLALSQWSISQAILEAGDTTSSSAKYQLAASVESIATALQQLDLYEQFQNRLTQPSHSQAETLADATISQPQPEKNVPLKKLPSAKRPLHQRINYRAAVRTTLTLALLAACARPAVIFDFAKQWDGGANNTRLQRQYQSGDSPLQLNNPDRSPAFTHYEQRKRPNTPANLSTRERLSLEKHNDNSSNRSHLPDLFLLAMLYYLVRRYIVRPLSEKFQGSLRPRHEGVHRQIRSPFRGRPNLTLAGRVESDNPALRDCLWMTSVWDPVSPKSFYRLDRDSKSVKINHRGFRSWFTNYNTKHAKSPAIRLPHRSLDQFSDTLINSQTRGPSYLRYFFPKKVSLERNIVWSEVRDLVRVRNAGTRQVEEADVALPISALPGRTISLPVPVGYNIVAIDLPKGMALWRSGYGTWQARGGIFTRGEIKYRVAPSSQPNTNEHDLPYLSAADQITARSEKMDTLVFRAALENTQSEIVQSLLSETKKLGAKMTYAPLHDHASSLLSRNALALQDAYPDYSEESLATSIVHKARACGVPSAMASGFRLAKTDRDSAFVVSEWSSSILVKASSDPSELKLCEIDIYPTFERPAVRKPQSIIKDLRIGIAAKLASIFGADSYLLSKWCARYENDVVDQDTSVSAAVDSPLLARCRIDPSAAAQLDDQALISKVRIAREAVTEFSGSANLTIPIDARFQSAEQLVELNVAALQQRLIEKAGDERNVRWWSRQVAPVDTYALLSSCMKPTSSLEGDNLPAALSLQEAGHVFFSAAEFKRCFETHRYSYLNRLFSFLDTAETLPDQELYQKQRDFYDHIVAQLAKPPLSKMLGVSAKHDSERCDLGAQVLQPALSWLIKSCQAGHLSSTQVAADFAALSGALRTYEGVPGARAINRAQIESLFAPKAHSAAYSNPTIIKQLLILLASDKNFSAQIERDGTPTVNTLRFLQGQINIVCRQARTDAVAAKIENARKIIETFELLNFDTELLTPALTTKPPWSPSDILARSSQAKKLPIEKLLAEIDSTATAHFTPDEEFYHHTAHGASLLLREALIRNDLPVPLAVEANITAPPENLEFVYTYPHTFNTFQVYLKSQKFGQLTLPDSQIWQLVCPNTCRELGVNASGSSNTSHTWLTRGKSHNAETDIYILLNHRTTLLPHYLHREIAWAFHLLCDQISQQPSGYDLKTASERFWSDWVRNQESQDQVFSDSFNRLRLLLADQPESIYKEANLLVTAWLEVGARKIDSAHEPSPSYLHASVYRIAKLYMTYEAADTQSTPVNYSQYDSLRAFFDINITAINTDPDESLWRQELIASCDLYPLTRTLSSEAFLQQEGIGERITRLSGLDFTEVRPYQAGDEWRMINQRASARANSAMVNAFHQSEATAYCAIVSLPWLAADVSAISIGHNLERLLHFLRAAYSDQMPTEIVLHLDGEVVERFSSREIIKAMSAPELTIEFVDKLITIAQVMQEYESTFGQVSDDSYHLPKIPVLGGVHPIVFSKSSSPSGLYSQVYPAIGRHSGCTIVGDYRHKPKEANIKENAYEVVT